MSRRTFLFSASTLNSPPHHQFDSFSSLALTVILHQPLGVLPGVDSHRVQLPVLDGGRRGLVGHRRGQDRRGGGRVGGAGRVHGGAARLLLHVVHRVGKVSVAGLADGAHVDVALPALQGRDQVTCVRAIRFSIV